MMNKKIQEFSPEIVIKNFLQNVIPDEYKKESLAVFITSVASAFLCYFMLMVTGLAGPDAVIEGVYMYQGFGWAVSIGRWFIAYAQRHLAFNAIVPFLIVIMYCILISLASMCIFRMFNIRNVISEILLTALFVSFPVVTQQFTFLYMAVYYALSFFCVALGILLIRKRKVWGYVLATILFVVMLGAYQTYIAEAATLAVMLLMLDIIDKKNKSRAFADFGAIAGIGIIASVLDLFIMRAAIAKEGVTTGDKVAGFSLTDILENFSFSFKYAFKWFFTYFEDNVMSRNVLYVIIFVLIIGAALIFVIGTLKEKKWIDALIVCMTIYLIPHTMNLFQYLFPHNGIFDIMRYHYVLIFALLVALLNRIVIPILAVPMRWVSLVVMLTLTMTYMASANIAGIVFKVIYTETYTEASVMLNRVYALDGFKKGETKVVLANPISWESTRTNFGLLMSETRIGAGPVFWNGYIGLNGDRRNYFINYLGVEVGLITQEEYDAIINSNEYIEMPCWPADGSVSMINGYAVVKNE